MKSTMAATAGLAAFLTLGVTLIFFQGAFSWTYISYDALEMNNAFVYGVGYDWPGNNGGSDGLGPAILLFISIPFTISAILFALCYTSSVDKEKDESKRPKKRVPSLRCAGCWGVFVSIGIVFLTVGTSFSWFADKWSTSATGTDIIAKEYYFTVGYLTTIIFGLVLVMAVVWGLSWGCCFGRYPDGKLQTSKAKKASKRGDKPGSF